MKAPIPPPLGQWEENEKLGRDVERPASLVDRIKNRERAQILMLAVTARARRKDQSRGKGGAEHYRQSVGHVQHPSR